MGLLCVRNGVASHKFKKTRVPRDVVLCDGNEIRSKRYNSFIYRIGLVSFELRLRRSHENGQGYAIALVLWEVAICLYRFIELGLFIKSEILPSV